jgi:hypothetical protein
MSHQKQSQSQKKYIGARFSKKEKTQIKTIAKKYNLSLSDLLRQSVFSHIAILEKYDIHKREYQDYVLLPIETVNQNEISRRNLKEET